MKDVLDRPRLLGLVCAAGAVGLGLAYLAAASAPPVYIAVNLGALILGATMWLILDREIGARLARNGRTVLILSLPLLATAVLGVAVAGASRWVSVGPLNIQSSLVLLPAMIVLYSRSPDAMGTVGIAITALALGLQPDRAMAGVLTAGLLGCFLTKPDRLAALGLASAISALGATLLQSDALPAVPFVDRILYSAFDVHVLAGLGVLAGSVVLLLPAVANMRRWMNHRPVMLAFGLSWLGVVAAAALGNYPTPLVGYGGSAILGYLLSVALLPSNVRATAGGYASGGQVSSDPDRDGEIRQLRASDFAPATSCAHG